MTTSDLISAGSGLHPELGYDDNPDFNESLDEQQPIEIAGVIFPPSRVLFEMEREAYAAALQEFRGQQREELLDVVCNEFPTPIAWSFYRFLYGSENPMQRLHFLRDTWEGLINLLHALVVSEFRSRHIPLIGAKLKASDLLTEKVGVRLLNLERLLSLEDERARECMCRQLIPLGLIQTMRELNRLRAGFSHSSALSEAEALRIISQYQEEVVEVLQQLTWLRDFMLVRYMGQAGNALRVRYERFTGYAMTRTIKEMRLAEDKLPEVAKLLDDKQILAVTGGVFLSLRPFVHFTEAEHLSKLGFFRKREGGKGKPVIWLFQLTDETAPFAIEERDLPEVGELDELCGA